LHWESLDKSSAGTDTCQPLLAAFHTQLTMAVPKRLLAVNWSPMGSNRRNEEDETVYCTSLRYLATALFLFTGNMQKWQVAMEMDCL